MMSPAALLWPWRPQSSLWSREVLRFTFSLVGAVFLSVFLSGCPSKTPVAQAPPPPPPPAPVASLEVSQATVQSGQTVTLTWKTEHATVVSIDPLGPVQANGSQTVTPTESTTYHLVAKGSGGSQEASARVTVASVAVENIPPTPEADLETVRNGRLDVFFDLDADSIRPDQVDTIKSDVAFLKRNPDMRILIAGHCDEKGSEEYNMVLGEERALAVKSALEKGGINIVRMQTTTWGKEKPFCEQETEACLQLNRRVHISPVDE